MHKNNVCFVVPIYKTELSPGELISIRRLYALYKDKKDIVIISPESIALPLKEGLLSLDINSDIHTFPDSYFKSISGYNDLMLSKTFYEHFINYKYIQISQLDTFIFKDEIDYWTSLNYDYIGAPWINFAFNNDKNILKLLPLLQRYIVRNTKLNNIFKLYRVGNGGFSLRKVSSFIETLNRLEDSKYKKFLHLVNEDIVWSLIAPKINSNFSIPKYKEALNYAFEIHAELCYQMNNKKLPFGCHAWEKHAPSFWSQFIKF